MLTTVESLYNCLSSYFVTSLAKEVMFLVALVS